MDSKKTLYYLHSLIIGHKIKIGSHDQFMCTFSKNMFLSLNMCLTPYQSELLSISMNLNWGHKNKLSWNIRNDTIAQNLFIPTIVDHSSKSWEYRTANREGIKSLVNCSWIDRWRKISVFDLNKSFHHCYVGSLE